MDFSEIFSKAIDVISTPKGLGVSGVLALILGVNFADKIVISLFKVLPFEKSERVIVEIFRQLNTWIEKRKNKFPLSSKQVEDRLIEALKKAIKELENGQ